jgi:hypothetical protein
MPDPQITQSKRWANTRRSQRVLLRVPIVVRQAEGDSSLSEDSYTLVVNAHGALVALAMKVQPGQKLVLSNRTTGEDQECRVVQVGEQHASKNEVGIEFTPPAPHFWHIDFPPADWKPLLD